jgi:beta-glucosidase
MKDLKYIFILALGLTIISSCNQKDTNSGTSHGKWKSFSGDKRIEQRVDSVLKLMTLEEKIGQMTQFSANWSITVIKRYFRFRWAKPVRGIWQ